MKLTSDSEEVTIKLDTKKLAPAQIRLIKSLNATLSNVLTTSEESEFFDMSAEFMRLCAAIINQSNFTSIVKKNAPIPYAEQAIEYSIDILQECVEQSKVVTYDN